MLLQSRRPSRRSARASCLQRPHPQWWQVLVRERRLRFPLALLLTCPSAGGPVHLSVEKKRHDEQ